MKSGQDNTYLGVGGRARNPGISRWVKRTMLNQFCTIQVGASVAVCIRRRIKVASAVSNVRPVAAARTLSNGGEATGRVTGSELSTLATCERR
jgi:hypothetical protein